MLRTAKCEKCGKSVPITEAVTTRKMIACKPCAEGIERSKIGRKY